MRDDNAHHGEHTLCDNLARYLLPLPLPLPVALPLTSTHSMASTPSAIISPALAATMWMPGEI